MSIVKQLLGLTVAEKLLRNAKLQTDTVMSGRLNQSIAVNACKNRENQLHTLDMKSKGCFFAPSDVI